MADSAVTLWADSSLSNRYHVSVVPSCDPQSALSITAEASGKYFVRPVTMARVTGSIVVALL